VNTYAFPKRDEEGKAIKAPAWLRRAALQPNANLLLPGLCYDCNKRLVVRNPWLLEVGDDGKLKHPESLRYWCGRTNHPFGRKVDELVCRFSPCWLVLSREPAAHAAARG